MKGRHKTASSCNSHKQVFGVVSLPPFFFPHIFSALTLFLVTYFFKHTLTTLYFSHTRTHTHLNTLLSSLTHSRTLSISHILFHYLTARRTVFLVTLFSLSASIFRTHTLFSPSFSPSHTSLYGTHLFSLSNLSLSVSCKATAACRSSVACRETLRLHTVPAIVGHQ